jgi:cytochrome P450
MSAAITYTCYFLCLLAQYQKRLRDEIRSKIPSASHELACDDIESPCLLDGVCREAVRLYPPIPITVREAVRPTTVAGVRVPQGTRILLCPYTINRCLKTRGADSDRFVPECWSKNDDNRKSGQCMVSECARPSTNLAQMVFSHGQRSCIGRDFGQAALRCVVAGLIGTFKMRLHEPGK